MKRMAAMTAAACLLGAGAADAQQRARPTQAELFCHDLKRVVQASSYETRFEHLERSRAAPPWLGFRPGGCRAYAGTDKYPAAWQCHQHLSPAHLTAKTLTDMTAACLPKAKRVEARGWREAGFETPRVRIHISESGGPGAKVGRIVRYRVEAVAGKQARR